MEKKVLVFSMQRLEGLLNTYNAKGTPRIQKYLGHNINLLNELQKPWCVWLDRKIRLWAGQSGSSCVIWEKLLNISEPHLSSSLKQTLKVIALGYVCARFCVRAHTCTCLFLCLCLSLPDVHNLARPLASIMSHSPQNPWLTPRNPSMSASKSYNFERYNVISLLLEL